MSKNKDRMSAKEVRQTARSLEKSLRSAQKGLDSLHRSLKASGFQEAATSYRQLQMILIQQRLWARDYKRTELNSQWKKIAESANGIHELLRPLIEIMNELQAIDRIEATSPVEQAASAQGASEQGASEQEILDATAPNLPLPINVDTSQTIATDSLTDALIDEVQISRYRLVSQHGEEESASPLQIDPLIDAGLLERRGWGRGESYRLTSESRTYMATAFDSLIRQSAKMDPATTELVSNSLPEAAA